MHLLDGQKEPGPPGWEALVVSIIGATGQYSGSTWTGSLITFRIGLVRRMFRSRPKTRM
jgi:hypothetical protein